MSGLKIMTGVRQIDHPVYYVHITHVRGAIVTTW